MKNQNSYIEYVTLHVPYASIDAYKAVNPWKNFKSIVEMKLGDVNGDRIVDVADIASVIDCMSGSNIVQKGQADVNMDGTIDVADIAAIIDRMASSSRQQQADEEE